MQRVICAACIALFASPALATGWVDLRFVGNDIELEDGVDDIDGEGDGFSLRSELKLNDLVFLRGSYTPTTIDDIEVNGFNANGVEIDLDVLRLGAGLFGGSSFEYFGALEWTRVDIGVPGAGSDDDDGITLSGGLRDNGQGPFLWNVELGLVALDEVEGGTFAFDLGWRINPMFAIVVGGRSYNLEEDDTDAELEYVEGSIGVRLAF